MEPQLTHALIVQQPLAMALNSDQALSVSTAPPRLLVSAFSIRKHWSLTNHLQWFAQPPPPLLTVCHSLLRLRVDFGISLELLTLQQVPMSSCLLVWSHAELPILPVCLRLLSTKETQAQIMMEIASWLQQPTLRPLSK